MAQHPDTELATAVYAYLHRSREHSHKTLGYDRLIPLYPKGVVKEAILSQAKLEKILGNEVAFAPWCAFESKYLFVVPPDQLKYAKAHGYVLWNEAMVLEDISYVTDP